MEEVEEWRPVVDWEDIYEVSSLGRIRKSRNGVLRKPSMTPKYPHILLCRNKLHKNIRVHRIVAKAFCEKREGADHVNHINGNTRDNRAVNLEWVTQAENNRHAYSVLGRRVPAFEEPRIAFKTASNKITTVETVLEFRRLRDSGIVTEDIGPMFGINGTTVRRYLRRLEKGEFDEQIKELELLDDHPGR